MSNFTDETYVPARITYRSGDDPGAIGAGKIWVDASTEPPTVNVRNRANNGWDTVGGGGGGGGAVAAIRKTFTFTDLETYVPQAFPITGGSGSTATVIVAGDHTALFPVGGEGSVTDQNGSGSYCFNISSSTFDGTHTTVVFGQTFTPDDLTGFFLTNFGQVANSEIYTPTNPGKEILMGVAIEVSTGLVAPLISSTGIHIGVYSVADACAQGSLNNDGSQDTVIGISDAIGMQLFPAQWEFGGGQYPKLLNVDGITLTVDDAATGGDPGLTAGEITITLFIATVTDA